MNATQQGVICLLKSAITEEAGQLPQDFSLEQAYDLLSKQGLLPLAYQGARNCGISQNEPSMQKMLTHCYQHMVCSERQMRAVQRVMDALEQADIDYLPVKGCNMKHLYPKPELRVMGDADILIRREDFARCAPIMEQLGFCRKVESDHTDNWSSADLYLELHKSLVPPEDADYHAYYGTGWDKAVQTRSHRYDLSPEDTFIFLFTHFARHYRISGIGCRHVADLFVYRRAYPDLSEDFIRTELKKLKLLTFYENTLRLLSVWFGGEPGDEITELMSAFIFSGGSWGTMEAGLYAQELKKSREKGQGSGAKRRSWLRALFPPLSAIRNRYPVLKRAPVLLPVMWVIRWLDVLLFSRKKMQKKLQILRKLDDNAILSHQQAMSAVGLEL